ncbi:lysylphosphatidylglycerol synthase transmembrane domain-containing protein [Sphingobacterium chungjuense]|uniref:lysylphosphatidylglycerol synthase transmembrane domain-containing protein n=1 Tax=Sphingobacterium chungjuense TaxID=2675553 RepID=UPI00140E1CAC|nr:lysylphosphatidylglycerol synthase transmembrane domain-containing protein [Sphingobacterium chungjuense]
MSTKTLYKVVFILLGIGSLVYMVYALGIDNIWANLQQTGIWFIPVLLSWFVIYFMNALAFRDIIRENNYEGAKISFGRILQLTISGYAINYITPFVALGGEPYRIMSLTPALGKAKASSSVLLYGMMHILSHLVFWVLSIGLIIFYLPVSPTVIATCVVIIALAGGLLFWVSRISKHGILNSVFRVATKLPFIGKAAKRLQQKNETLFTEIDMQINDLYKHRKPKFYSSLFWEFFARVIGCVEIYLIARALGLEMNYIEAIIVSSGSSLFANLIFFFPMQLGTREGGMALAMSVVGFSASAGVFIGLATRIRELIWIVIGLLLTLLVRNKTAPLDVEENLKELSHE